MNTLVWKKGPPPHVGWWNAINLAKINCFELDEWRWWDGKHWSIPAHSYMSGEEAQGKAKKISSLSNATLWCNRWPENARVSRNVPSFAPVMTLGHIGQANEQTDDLDDRDEPGGDWIDFDIPDHGGVAKAVWRMESDERSPKMEEIARRLVASWNYCRHNSLETLEVAT